MSTARFLLLAGLLAGAGRSQEGLYRFAVDQDALSGAPDFSFLNAPLTADDKITVRRAHFVTTDGKRVRFFGVNLSFSANFPSPDDGVRIAKRLRRLGVNLVRLHHLDTQPDANPANAASLLTTGPYPTLNENSVRWLRAFLDALKAEGIYVNLNLKVGYVFRPAVDGLPGGAIPAQSKPLHVFVPRMIELQQEYARKTIQALQLADDPVLAMVEISNESSLLHAYQANQLNAAVEGAFRREMEGQWNGYLRGRYQSTEAVRDSWGGTESDSGQLLPERWRLEVHSGASATLAETAGGAVEVTFTRNQSQVIAKQVGFSVAAGEAYLAEMEIRAEQPTPIYWDVKQDVSPWRTAANRNITATPVWQRFTLAFTAPFDMDGIGRFGVQISGSTTPVQIRNARLTRRGRRGLQEGESLEAANIALPGTEGSNETRTRDFIEFLAALDKNYLDSMVAAVRESTAGRVPVAGTQMEYGGLQNIDTHASLDYYDSHFYVDHYNFPNVAWDGRDWRIRDSSHLASGLSNLANLAAARPAGKPYTVSEFNQNWPNTRGHELLPPLSAYAAFQDWDGLMHFAYSHGRAWDANVPNGFNLNGDWSKWITFGQSAWLFRSGAVRISDSVVPVPVSYADRLRFTRERRNRSFAAFLSETRSIPQENLLRHRVEIDPDAGGALPPPAVERRSGPVAADTGEFLYDPEARRFVLHAPMAAGILGEWSGPVSAGPLEAEPLDTGRRFRTILLTSLDGKPLEESGRLLLTNPGYTLRSRSGVEPRQPQRLVLYPSTSDWLTVEPDLPGKPSGNLNGGEGPTWMERTDTRITLRTRAAGLTVFPLDGAGNRMEPLEVTAGEGGFGFVLNAGSPWYEVVAER